MFPPRRPLILPPMPVAGCAPLLAYQTACRDLYEPIPYSVYLACVNRVERNAEAIAARDATIPAGERSGDREPAPDAVRSEQRPEAPRIADLPPLPPRPAPQRRLVTAYRIELPVRPGRVIDILT